MINTYPRLNAAKHIAAHYCILSVRRTLRWARRNAVLPTAAFLALVSIESTPGFMAVAEDQPAIQQQQHRDADKPERKRPSIVNNSSDGPTIHFTACRENDKGHVSCSFDDADGKQHWVYLAGYKLPTAK